MAANNPNIVIILADDLGYADTGYTGQRDIRTPNLDAMARDGIQFTRAYTGAPVCAPSRCTLLTGVPTSYLSMLQHPDRQQFDLSTLRAGTCGGSDCDPGVLARCAAEFPIPGLVQVYGQTEASTLIALDDPDSPDRWATSGYALEGMELRITHPDTRSIMEPMALGQIEVRGPMVMMAYLYQPEATSKTIDEDGWMQTGDLGYLRPDGRLVIAGGRLRDMIIRGGENIYPVEVENLLREHPAVGEVAVFGLPDTYYGETVAAAVSCVPLWFSATERQSMPEELLI